MEIVELFKEIRRAIEEVWNQEPKALIGGIVIFVTFLIEIILVIRGKLGMFGDKEQIAKERGNVLIGTRESCTRHSRYLSGDYKDYWTTRYVYYVGDKKKKYVCGTRGYAPPEQIELYYLKKPNKVFSEYEYTSSIHWLYIIPIVMGILVVWFMNCLGF